MIDGITLRLETFMASIPPEMRNDPRMHKFIRLIWMGGAAACKEVIMQIGDMEPAEAALALMQLEKQIKEFADTERAKHWGGENPINQ